MVWFTRDKRHSVSGESNSLIDKDTAITKVIAKESRERKTSTENIKIESIEDFNHGWLVKVGFLRKPRQTFIGSSNFRFVDKRGDRIVWLSSGSHDSTLEIEKFRRFGTRDVRLPEFAVHILFDYESYLENVEDAKSDLTDREIDEDVDQILRSHESELVGWFTQYTDFDFNAAQMAYERFYKNRAICVIGQTEQNLAHLTEKLERLGCFYVKPLDQLMP